MSRFPDSLIARKCGSTVAQQASDRAAAVLAAGSPQDESFWQAGRGFGFLVTVRRHRRNPGTTADLIAAGLFVLLREGIMHLAAALAVVQSVTKAKTQGRPADRHARLVIVGGLPWA